MQSILFYFSFPFPVRPISLRFHHSKHSTNMCKHFGKVFILIIVSSFFCVKSTANFSTPSRKLVLSVALFIIRNVPNLLFLCPFFPSIMHWTLGVDEELTPDFTVLDNKSIVVRTLVSRIRTEFSQVISVNIIIIIIILVLFSVLLCFFTSIPNL